MTRRPFLAWDTVLGIPSIHGDKFRPADYILDKMFSAGALSDLFKNISFGASILEGLDCSLVADVIAISQGSIFDLVQPSLLKMHDFDSTVVVEVTPDDYYAIAQSVDITNIPTDLLPDGVYYLNAKLEVTPFASRKRVSNIYVDYAFLQSFNVIFSLDAAPNICLGTLTKAAGVPTLSFEVRKDFQIKVKPPIYTDRTATLPNEVPNLGDLTLLHTQFQAYLASKDRNIANIAKAILDCLDEQIQLTTQAIQNEIDARTQAVQSLNSALSNLSSTVTNINSSLATLTTTVNNINVSNNNQVTDISSLNSALASLELALQGMADNINSNSFVHTNSINGNRITLDWHHQYNGTNSLVFKIDNAPWISLWNG